jgi:hypothetical protein
VYCIAAALVLRNRQLDVFCVNALPRKRKMLRPVAAQERRVP